MALTCWKNLIFESLKRNNEIWDDIEAIEVTFRCLYDAGLSDFENKELTCDKVNQMSDNEKLELYFYDGYKGSPCPIQFQAWTKNYIYFSNDYDCSDFVTSKKRNSPKRILGSCSNNFLDGPIGIAGKKGK